MKIRTILITIILVLMTIGYTSLAFGAISADEASKLDGPVLTPIGAIKAGNADGSIPAWTGVPIPIPKGFKPGSGVYVDPFAGEKPILTINAKNMAQYADKLTEGAKALMRKYPDYRIDVYPTHRTAVYPKSIMDMTKKCAATAYLTDDGQTLNGCRGGIPFPIPKTGDEMIWNHLIGLGNFGENHGLRLTTGGYNITASGRVTQSTMADFTFHNTYFDPDFKDSWQTFGYHALYTAPARRNGEKVFALWPDTWKARNQVTWQYLPGQRRVRLAPDICCDTPNVGNAGVTLYDETWIFQGNPDRYAWKILGKKEMYVPANGYKFAFYKGPVEKLVLGHFINPDYTRWELRRVWVVEASLKPQKRHILYKRILYADEDSYGFVASDNYDKQHQLYHISFLFPPYIYDQQTMYAMGPQCSYDLMSNSYTMLFWVESMKYSKAAPPRTFYNPDALAGGGLR